MDIQDYANGVTAKAVIRFLNKNPDFLAENPSVFEKQDLGFKEATIVDLQRMQVERLREKVETLEQRQRVQQSQGAPPSAVMRRRLPGIGN